MGNIVGAFGIKGWVKIKTSTMEADALIQYKDLYLLINGKYTLCKLEDGFIKNNVLHAKFADVIDRDQAEALRGVAICVSRDDFPQALDDEYYWIDLINCTVFNQAGECFGSVSSLMETGSSSILVIKNDSSNKEILIPFVADYITDVDLKGKKITVVWELDYC